MSVGTSVFCVCVCVKEEHTFCFLGDWKSHFVPTTISQDKKDFIYVALL